MPGQSFQGFGSVKINDAGDVTFAASFNSGRATFRASNGTLQLIAQGAGQSNSRGDVVFSSDGVVFLFSNGSPARIAVPGQAISNSTLRVDTPQYPSINDDGDVVFVNGYLVTGRVIDWFPNAVVRWHGGVLEKIAAIGDPVPGITGATLDGSFGPPEINQSGILFTSRM
jgi:hypothetical protein